MGIVEDMESVLKSGAFFTETVTHKYPTLETEELVIIWSEPDSDHETLDSTSPSLIMKTSEAGNLDQGNSRFYRKDKIYSVKSIFPDVAGHTKIELSETDT